MATVTCSINFIHLSHEREAAVAFSYIESARATQTEPWLETELLLKAPEDHGEQQEVTASLAAVKEISTDTVIVAVLVLKVEQRTKRFTLLPILFGKSLVNPLTGRKPQALASSCLTVIHSLSNHLPKFWALYQILEMLHLLCQVKHANAVETHCVHAVCQTTSKGSRIVTTLNTNLQMHLHLHLGGQKYLKEVSVKAVCRKWGQ